MSMAAVALAIGGGGARELELETTVLLTVERHAGRPCGTAQDVGYRLPGR